MLLYFPDIVCFMMVHLSFLFDLLCLVLGLDWYPFVCVVCSQHERSMAVATNIG